MRTVGSKAVSFFSPASASAANSACRPAMVKTSRAAARNPGSGSTTSTRGIEEAGRRCTGLSYSGRARPSIETASRLRSGQQVASLRSAPGCLDLRSGFAPASLRLRSGLAAARPPIADQGLDRESFQALAAAQERQLDHEEEARHLCALPLDQGGGRAGGPAGGQEGVDDQRARPGARGGRTGPP